MSKKDAKRGLYQKFRVTRTDGRDAIGKKHDHCEYFVLDLTHDEFAVPALLAYAEACEKAYPALSADLLAKVESIFRNDKLGKLLTKVGKGRQR